MTILAPSEALRTAPTPTCEGWDGVGPDATPCDRPGEYLIGIRYDCCGEPSFVEHQFTCLDCYTSHNDRCVDCGAPVIVSEPVRGAASDGRTE